MNDANIQGEDRIEQGSREEPHLGIPINTRFPPDIHKRILIVAEEEDRKKSEIVRRLVKNGFKYEDAEKSRR